MKIEAKPFPALDAEKLPGGLIPAVIQDDRTLQVLMPVSYTHLTLPTT